MVFGCFLIENMELFSESTLFKNMENGKVENTEINQTCFHWFLLLRTETKQPLSLFFVCVLENCSKKQFLKI